MKDQTQVPQMKMMNMNQQQQQQQQGMVGQPSQMMNRGGGGGYGMWPPPGMSVDQLKFQNPKNMQNNLQPPLPGFVVSQPMGMGRNNNINKNWKGKKGNDKRIRKDINPVVGGGIGIGSTSGVGGGVGVGYKPPTLNELQQQNRVKARRFFGKKKFNNNGNNNNNGNKNRFAPYAPRNTTSFIIRAKKSGGITSLVSPCPVTPAVLPTPIFSPSREVLVDMAKEEWGVDGYGSMKGLIRLRSPGNEAEDDEEEDGGSSESDVEEHVEVERRLDHDLSRFEMIYPNSGSGAEQNSHYLLENRVDDQDTHIAQLEEENLILKERLFLMEREFDDLRRRLICLERQNQGVEENNEEVVENESQNDSESRGSGGRFVDENNEEVFEENNEGSNYVEIKKEIDDQEEHKEINSVENSVDQLKDVMVDDVCMEEHVKVEQEKNDRALQGAEKNRNANFEAKERNNDVGFEESKEIITEVPKNVEFRDVCMDEPGSVQDVPIVETQANDQEAGLEC